MPIARIRIQTDQRISISNVSTKPLDQKFSTIYRYFLTQLSTTFMLNVFSGKASKLVEQFIWPDCYIMTETQRFTNRLISLGWSLPKIFKFVQQRVNLFYYTSFHKINLIWGILLFSKIRVFQIQQLGTDFLEIP